MNQSRPIIVTIRNSKRLLTKSGFRQRRICRPHNDFPVDFFVEEDGAIIEVELVLSRAHTNFEQDIFKALIARDAGMEVSHLIILGEPGSKRRQGEPAPRSIIRWAREHHTLSVKIQELRRN